MADLPVWIDPFGEVFLDIDRAGVIRQVIGAVQDVLEASPDMVIGLSWQQLAVRFASEAARPGLLYAWEALVERRIDPAHFPEMFPFRPGLIVRLRPYSQGAEPSFVGQLCPSPDCELGCTLSASALDTVTRVLKTGQHITRGTVGPLTDLQVAQLGELLEGAGHVEQLLKDWRAELLVPCNTAPLPHLLTELLTFKTGDFPHRRVVTHELAVHTTWSRAVVYCAPALRATVSDIILALLSSINPQSAIDLRDRAAGDVVEIEIAYRTPDSAMQVWQRLEPLSLTDPARFGPLLSVQNLITSAQACLTPVKGRVWAEPGDQPGAARLILAVPRWRQKASSSGKRS